MPALLVKSVTDELWPQLDSPEMTIDLAAMTWTCTEHGTVMPLDGGTECAECAMHSKAPPGTPHPLRDSLVG